MYNSAKKILRKQYTSLRDAIPQEVRATAGASASRTLACQELFLRAPMIYTYVNMRSEFPTEAIIADCFARKKSIAAPRISGREIDFYRIATMDDLEPGTFGVREPKKHCPAGFEGFTVASASPSLMLVPGLAFTRDGRRLGYGAGYYDRYFAKHCGFVLIGVCYESQIAQNLPCGPYDVPMEYLLTERGLFATV